MINASQEFKNLISKGVKIVNYADITLRDGTVLNLGPSDFSVGGFSMSDKTTNGKFEIGTAIAKNISVTIANHTNKFSAYDFYKSIIYMYVAIEKEDGTVLKERKGKYYVINPTTPSDTIRLSGVDSMYLFDKPYNASTAFPATLQTILSDCCIDCGVNIGFGQFDNWNYVVMHKPTDCTYRQVVSWVAQISGCHARINNNDYLELVWYDTSSLEKVNIDGGNYFVYENDNIIDGGDFTTYESDLIIDGGSFTDYSPPNITKIKPPTVLTDNVVITGIKVEYNKKEVLLGTEDYLISVKDNPFVADKENEVCQYLSDRLIGLSFRPLSCQMVNNPLFEPFDSCYVYDRKGNAYFTLINDVTYTISGFTTISCKAEDPVRNESSYVSESAKAIAQAKRNTEKQLTTYDKAVQNMNLLAANSMGLYRESETQSDGSIIYYMSNRPITKNDNGVCSFETNSVVYKMTGDGFFVSEDGGITYTSGFDAEGNAVVNVLSAIGITFDWAKGGTLSLGGNNNINGSMVVYDAEGNIIGKFNKDGLWASNGYFEGIIKSTSAEITGGSINIETDNKERSVIQISYDTDLVRITPSFVQVGNYNNGTLIFDDSIKVGSLTGSKTLIKSGDIIVGDSSSFYVEIKNNGITVGGSSVVSGVSISQSEISLNHATLKVPLYSSIEIGGTAKFTGDVTIESSLYTFNVKAACSITKDVTLGSELSVSGKAKFNSGLSVIYGYSEYAGIDSSGNIFTKAKLTVDGETSLKGNCSIGDSTSDKLSFFGGTGATKKTVSTIYTTSSATASSNATKINEIINALKAYNLM